MKMLIAFSCLLAVSAAQTTNYPYSAYLDSDGYFLLKWDVRPSVGDIEMQFVVNATGWVSLLIASEDGSYADVIFGGYNEETTYGYYADMHCGLLEGPSHTAPVNDESPDLVFQSATYEKPYTTLTVKRSIYTGDKDDVAIRAGPLLLGWSFSDMDTSTVPHTNAGFATLALIPF
ncbi:uncharacterized protein LOC116921518 [Daphnia magna]|uniref:DOMON domain-containing protein n=1 Tax=Daphnia magna TaxID=35525 RepID=A0ABQ9ZDD8_9CRUS|nr:uncharacterized protein LOC116921518 [Daphnia magna]XP_032783755.2 uncharacterized protein LOC116921518 [Daphnia magna]KAK4010920.1 hypothetical protein OUZ56_020042 [Daphnia magna]